MKRIFQYITIILGIVLVLNFSSCEMNADSKESVNCTVTYKTERGTTPSSITVKQNTVLSQSQLPELKSNGYNFLGWYDDDTKAVPEKYKVKKNVTLTAEWEIDPDYKEYTVEFNSMGGSFVSKQTIVGGHKVSKPQNPTKQDSETERFVFENWYTSSDNGTTLSSQPFDFDTPVNSNITLYAKWTITDITYTIKYETKHGSAPASIVIKKDTVLTNEQLPIISAAYCTFNGWFIEDEEITVERQYKVTKDVTLTAHWTVQKFKIKFETEIGSAPAAIQVEATTILSDEQLPVLTSDGHVFTGWFDENSKKAESGKYVVTHEVTLTGVWDKDVVTIIYENQYGSAPKPVVLLKGTEITTARLPELSLQDYEFLGWCIDHDRIKEDDLVSKDITLTAEWKRIYYTVNFNTNGGGTIVSQRVASGDKAARPNNPSKNAIISESYSFENWYTSTNNGVSLSTEAFNFDTPIRSDITLYAKWTAIPVTFTVKFDSMGGSSVANQTIKYGEKAERPVDPTKQAVVSEGYTFAGWYTSADNGQTLSSAFNFNSQIKSDITLYAKWNPTTITYTVTFNTNGGTSVSSQTVTGGQKATRPAVNPTKAATDSEKYTFAGWYTSTNNGQTLSSKPFDFDTPVTNNITLYAKWNPTTITYTVTFNSKGGSTVSSQTVIGGQKATRPENPTKTASVSESYSFAGWYTSTDYSTPFDFEKTPVTKNITLYAKWSVLSITYKVTFDSNGGTEISSQIITGGQKVAKPSDPTKQATVSEKYSFAGWYIVSEGDQSLFNFNTTITSDITLYAKWNPTTITYTINFDSRGGNTIPSQTVVGGQKVTRPSDPIKPSIASESYSFVDWYISIDGGMSFLTTFNFDSPLTNDITVYAGWKKNPINYTVTFNTRDGNAVSSQTIKGGQKVERPRNPYRVGKSYNFVDWYTSMDEGQHLSSDPFDFNTIINSDVTLYAKWDFDEPLTLEFLTSGTITITNPWSTLNYSKNGSDLINAKNTITVGKGDRISFYAQKSENNDSKKMNINCSSDCYIYGNVMSLITIDQQTGDWNPSASKVTASAFMYLFKSNTHIKNHDTKKLYLPAKTLDVSCYSSMFFGCTNLTKAPDLSASELADYCCHSMFSGCTGLTTTPSLSALVLKNSCYANMFSGCTSLAKVSTLSAQKLANSCYSAMFSGCTSLSSAPSLPVTKLADNCYKSMFSGCTSLTSAPTLSATTLSNSCYESMFSGCSSLTKAPSLPAKTLTSCCYYAMFSGCTSLSSAPSLPANTLSYYCYYKMFSGCTSLTSAPALSATILELNCYDSMFLGCTSLITAPDLPAPTLVSYCYESMFSGCEKLCEIKCLAKDVTAVACTAGWLSGVSTEGTFIKVKDAEFWSGVHGIPDGWTVVEVEE